MAKVAKPAPHGASRNDKSYEHKDITDNRLVWEVLEGGELNNENPMKNEGANHCTCCWGAGSRVPDPSCPAHKGS